MMAINTENIRLITQPIVETRVKIDVYDERNGNHIETWECGIISATFSISAESDIRRSCNLEVVPNKNKHIRLEKNELIWVNRIIKIAIGIKSMRTGEYTYFDMGKYVFNNYAATYDSVTNTISLSLSDFWLNLDGSRRGQVGGAPTISYPGYEEDENGNVIKYNYIRDIVITILTQLANIKDYNIGDIGEFKGIIENNPDGYAKYREESKVPLKDGTLAETWNCLPFDITFSAGTSIAEMLIKFRDLYPNYEMYFDKDGVFCCDMIPSCEGNDIVLNSDFLDRIYISENTSVDMTSIKNICEVWGQTIDADFFTDKCTYKNNIYSCTIDAYDKYYHGDLVAVTIPKVNQASCSIKINNLAIIPIIDENTEQPIESDKMEENQVYVFKIKNKYIENSSVMQAYLLGQWQAHGLNVLTNGSISNDDYTTQDGKTVKVFSKEYFQAKYNCKSVEFTTIEDSDFCVQELGEVLDVKSGGEFDNIESDSLALARADYENWKNCRLTDSITITTKLCPFADVNIKVAYRRKDINVVNHYLVKSLSHDISGGTTTWTLMRFYALYKDAPYIDIANTWKNANEYTWETLSNRNWNY